jgi:hypothetical protein
MTEEYREEEIVSTPVKIDKRSISSKKNAEKARAKAAEVAAIRREIKKAPVKHEIVIEEDSESEPEEQVILKVPRKVGKPEKQQLYSDVRDLKQLMTEWKAGKVARLKPPVPAQLVPDQFINQVGGGILRHRFS